MPDEIKYKTIVISDIHIGSKWSHAIEAMEFLKNNRCKKLILNGDIIDGWHLGRNRKRWKHVYNSFLKLLLDKQKDTEIIYIRGNHDDFLDNVVPFEYENISILRDYIYESNGMRFYVFHGDMFDSVTSKIRWMSKLGDKLYSILLQINRYYNDYRKRHGKEYFSISKIMKDKVKKYVSRFSAFDRNIVNIAHKHNCNGVICGHIHQPDMKYIKDILYINSGDWIESLSVVVEHMDGKWEVLHFGETKKKE